MPAQPTATIKNVASWTELDRKMMERALALASKGVGQVSPGPLVGCVIASPAGEVLGEGYYLFEQIKHAETYALSQAGSRAKGATAYVSLEPHAHYGRTPPCTDALISAGIARVFAPHEDPNPEVSGKGFAHLRSAGVEVSVGIAAREAELANEKYIHFIGTGRPFVHLKLAVSLDGKIATRTGDSCWITGPQSREIVQNLRHEYDAVLVGAGTVDCDDPLLTDRSGKPRRQQLVRVVLDERLTISANSQLARTAADSPVIIFAGEEALLAKKNALPANVEVVGDSTGGRNPLGVLEELGRRSVQSLLIEGGANVAGSFLDAGLVNKVSFFIAPKIIGGSESLSAVGGKGVERMCEALELENVVVTQHGRDVEITGYPHYKDEG
jgi:diaminohydroxyphosphoribosylaminopyrimidine deaminase / 5-amino-6-(5-phosphoribosylamino)uracil reductase